MGHIERLRAGLVAWMTGAPLAGPRGSDDGSGAATIQVDDVGPGRAPRVEERIRRWRPAGAVFVVVLTNAAAILLTAHVAGRPTGPGAGDLPSSEPTTTPTVERSEITAPRFIAPDTAVPGERITVLVFRNRRLCGPAELRFDGRPVTHRLDSYVGGEPNASWMEMFLIMQVPRSAPLGTHEIQLYGPVLGGRRDAMCADVHEHQGMLSTTTITIRATASI